MCVCATMPAKCKLANPVPCSVRQAVTVCMHSSFAIVLLFLSALQNAQHLYDGAVKRLPLDCMLLLTVSILVSCQGTMHCSALLVLAFQAVRLSVYDWHAGVLKHQL